MGPIVTGLVFDPLAVLFLNIRPKLVSIKYGDLCSLSMVKPTLLSGSVPAEDYLEQNPRSVIGTLHKLTAKKFADC